MKRMGLVAVGLVLCSLAAQAEIINTWEGGTNSWYNIQGDGGGAATQRFTVPDGQTGTKFEFWGMQHGSWNQTPGYYTNVAIYTASNALVTFNSYEWTDPIFEGGVAAWLPVPNLSLAPGQYSAQIWCSNSTQSSRFFLALESGSTYAGGYAANGWAPGAEISGGDFQTRLTVVPEPATLSLIVLGGLGLLRRRK